MFEFFSQFIQCKNRVMLTVRGDSPSSVRLWHQHRVVSSFSGLYRHRRARSEYQKYVASHRAWRQQIADNKLKLQDTT
jgi:hypothetical protein